MPFEHVNPAAQSVGAAHVVLHLPDVPSQARFEGHDFGDPATQSPVPSHRLSVSAAAVQTVAQVSVAPG